MEAIAKDFHEFCDNTDNKNDADVKKYLDERRHRFADWKKCCRERFS